MRFEVVEAGRFVENGLNVVNPLAEVTIFDTKTQNYSIPHKSLFK
jgi:hypothetical protein